LSKIAIKTIFETINIHDAIGIKKESEGTVNIFLNFKCNQLNERQISIIIQMPIGEGDNFRDVIDFITKQP
jgi:deferrochelatase/peroxidase EfeB